MPNNIIKYASGGACRARGKSNAIAPAGPSPGNTPTNVPSNTPRNPYRRLSGEAAVRIPLANKWSVSIGRNQISQPSKPLGNSAFNSTSKKKSENVEQERISDHPGNDVKDRPYFAEVRFGIFLRRTFSNTIDQATSSDQCYADGRDKREKPRPRPVAGAQAKPIRLDG